MESPLRILVIDDDDIARELLTSTLKDAGHDVSELPSAIGASREIFRHNIDVVVVDVMMPDINGDKLAKLLRSNPRGNALAIVLVSSRPADELHELARIATADAVVPKDRIRTELSRAVVNASRRRTERSSKPGRGPS
jgi:DNA-binding response OmpR family regulator